MSIVKNSKLGKNYDRSTCNEVVVYVSDEEQAKLERDICKHSKNDKSIKISTISKHLDPITYPIIYPSGGFGWTPYIKSNQKNSYISCLEFYKYKFNMRNDFYQFLNLGKHKQQNIVDAFVKVESTRVYFIRKKQSILRAKLY